MEIMKNYADLVRQIDIIETQIEMFEVDIDYWFGKNDVPLTGVGAENYGLAIAAERTDRLTGKLKELHKMLDFYREVKEDMDEHINSLEGLEFKVAHKRFVENKTYKEIADELDYSYDYIRHVASRSKKEQEHITMTTQTN